MERCWATIASAMLGHCPDCKACLLVTPPFVFFLELLANNGWEHHDHGACWFWVINMPADCERSTDTVEVCGFPLCTSICQLCNSFSRRLWGVHAKGSVLEPLHCFCLLFNAYTQCKFKLFLGQVHAIRNGYGKLLEIQPRQKQVCFHQRIWPM